MSIAFALQNIMLGVSLAAPIGPVAVEVMNRGLRDGFRSAFTVGLGAAVGDFFYLAVAYYGMASMMQLPLVNSIVWVVGATILIFLGYRSMKEAFQSEGTVQDSKYVHSNAFFVGIALATINPMSIVWWLAVFGTYMGLDTAEAHSFAQMMRYSTIILGVIIWNFLFSNVLAFGRRYVTPSRLKGISFLAGLCLMSFGAKFLFMALVEPYL